MANEMVREARSGQEGRARTRCHRRAFISRQGEEAFSNTRHGGSPVAENSAIMCAVSEPATQAYAIAPSPPRPDHERLPKEEERERERKTYPVLRPR